MNENKVSFNQTVICKQRIKAQALSLGFNALSFSQPNLTDANQRLKRWLDLGFHGDMAYMARNVDLRRNPHLLQRNTHTVISASLPYQLPGVRPHKVLSDPHRGYVARYALGRDYHKVVRHKLKQLVGYIQSLIAPAGFRVFCDSAPVMEVEIAQQSGLGWRGKNGLLLTRQGSLFFLGEIFTDYPLLAEPATNTASHCGECRKCLDLCPTQAIVAPGVVDARRCISYLTIEHHGTIPPALRKAIGNRIYGCDDCQLVCPWNKFAQTDYPADFKPRQDLDHPHLIRLFAWSERQFNHRLLGSPIRRIGYLRWLRNIAVALGNAPRDAAIRAALHTRARHPSALVREHVRWALRQQALP